MVDLERRMTSTAGAIIDAAAREEADSRYSSDMIAVIEAYDASRTTSKQESKGEEGQEG
jgi:hypothetical protein